MAAKKGQHIGPDFLDDRSPMRVYRGPFRAEKTYGTLGDLYFQTQDEMLNALDDKAKLYTPMIWNEEKKCYTIDFDSADILGI